MRLRPIVPFALTPRLWFNICLIFALVAAAPAHAQDSEKRSFDIPADTADKTLKLFSEQSGHGLLISTETAKGVHTKALKGEFIPREALDLILADTGLVASQDEKNGAFVVHREAESPNAQRAAQNSSDRPSENQKTEMGVIKLDTFEVMGSKLLNMDIKRDRDAPQPYVVFQRDAIERDGSTSIEDFLKNRLPQNSVGLANSNSVFSTNGNASQINLRGLGTNQTLILIDGRRTPGILNPFLSVGPAQQPDINGIPLDAVERIEILPTTASGIYGGGATGGVINIILKRDYSGVETTFGYENSFDTDTGIKRAELAAGFNLEHGKTNVLLSGSWSEQGMLTVQDRSFTQTYRNRFLANTGGNYQVFNTSTFPALGSTPNIRSTTGSNLTLKSGQALNSPITYIPIGYPGATSDGGTALLANAGKYNLQWGESGNNAILNGPAVKSIIATVRQQFNEWLQAFVDLGYSENKGFDQNVTSLVGSPGYTLPASLPGNPFNQSINVAVPIPFIQAFSSRIQSDRASGGLIAKLPGEWKMESDYVWNRTSNVFGSYYSDFPGLRSAIVGGTLDVLRDTNSYPFNPLAYDPVLPIPRELLMAPRTSLEDVTLRTAGPLPNLFLRGGNPITMSVLIEHRVESISDGTVFGGSVTPITLFNPSRSQSVDSGYMELSIPVIAQNNAVPGIHGLELQIAGRRDEYTTRGVNNEFIIPPAPAQITRATTRVGSSNPTLAVKYQPVKDVTLRASYGTGFLPPTPDQTAPSPANAIPFPVLDPRRGNTSTAIAVGNITAGGNPTIKPESSTSWSGGIILTPSLISGLRMSLDYTRVSKDNGIATYPGGFQGVVNSEALFPGRVVRGSNLPGDQPGWPGPIISVDNSLLNLSKVLVEAYDAQFDYHGDVGNFGTIDVYALASWTTHYETQLGPSQPVLENVGTSTNPLKLKANAGVSWTRGEWTLGLGARYFDSYLVYLATDTPASLATKIQNQEGSTIPSQIYYDVFMTYRSGSRTGGGFFNRMLARDDLTIGVRNVFNTKPPFDSNNPSVGYYSLYGDPRLATYYITLRKHF